MPKRYHNSIEQFDCHDKPGNVKSAVDTMAITRVYDDDVSEFIIACGQARSRMNGKHLSLSQVYQVLIGLGYRKSQPAK